MKVLLRRKVNTVDGQEIPSRRILEWNPTTGKWYPINYRNVQPTRPNNPGFMSRYREIMNRVLRGETVKVGAEYRNSHLSLFEVA